jgi:hypothetical protein
MRRYPANVHHHIFTSPESTMGELALEKENQKLEHKLDNIKRKGQEAAETMAEWAGAAALGFGYGYLNAKEGGTLENPYQVAGSVSLDLAMALGLGLLSLSSHGKEGFLPGAAGAAIGIYAARQGQSYEQTGSLSGSSTSTPAATTTSGPMVGMGSRMSRHPYLPAHYGARPFAGVRQAAGVRY